MPNVDDIISMTNSRSHDISQITDYLYISAWPRGEHAKEIYARNIRLVLSMHWIRPSRSIGESPVRILWLPTIDKPFAPIPLRVLHRGVEAALPVIQDGYAVLAHCRAGQHRSVAMACCVLIGRGYTAEAAMQLVKEHRPLADPYVEYIRNRILKFENHWMEYSHGS